MKLRLAYSVLALIVILEVAAIIYPFFPKRDVMTSHELTKYKMRLILEKTLEYHSDLNRWPDVVMWKQQLHPYLLKETRFSPEELFKDSWGTLIEYVVLTNEMGTIRYLHSLGHNRFDDHGTNDDIRTDISN